MDKLVITLTLLLCFCCLPFVSSFSKGYVEEIRQNFKPKSNFELVNQMAAFYRASLVYMAYASHFDRGNVNLPGFRKFFKTASDTSWKEAEKVGDYINTRGGHQQFPLLDMKAACRMMSVPRSLRRKLSRPQICELVMKTKSSRKLKKSYSFPFFRSASVGEQSSQEDWKHGLMGLNDALLMERNLNDQLLDMAKGADIRKDAHLRHTIEDSFLALRLERIKKLGDVIHQLGQYTEQEYPLGEYVMDLEMSK